MSCPTFNETRDWKNFNNSCVYFSPPANVLGAVGTCCGTSNVVTIDNGCHSYCNFTTINRELEFINCVYDTGNKTGISRNELRDAHPSCYAEVNRGVKFTWISNTLTTATATSSSRSSTPTITNGPATVTDGGQIDPAQTDRAGGGMGVPIAGFGKETDVDDDQPGVRATPNTSAGTTTTPATQAQTTPPTSAGVKSEVTSKAAFGLVAFMVWTMFF